LAKQPALTEACERFQLVFELTERHMLGHPQALLEKVAAIRADGIAIAVDDVGAHPDSLAVLDIIDPDIIKLDMTMIQNCTMRNKADALTGVLAHHERTGALIIAEGVETDGRRRRRSSLCSAATCPPTSAEGAQRRAATRRSAVPGVGRRRAWRGYV
jgi:EAL domain-containing protein (putative c-di-GMP-specific phosphodiesterase class I)